MLSEDAQRVGAKFDPETGSSAFHPLICHMLDVAAVAEAMWDDVLSPQATGLITDGLGLDESSARRWTCFLAGAHDLGKATPAFQSRDPNGHTRLSHLGVRVPANSIKDPGHGLVTAAFLPQSLESLGVRAKLARELSRVTGGHHGTFASLGSIHDLQDRRESAGEHGFRNAWNSVRGELTCTLAELVGLPSTSPSALTMNSALALAGLISVVDWIGSMSDVRRAGVSHPWHFCFDQAGAADPASYFERQRENARTALRAIGWTGVWSSEGTPRRTFAELFSNPAAPMIPRPLQAEVIDIAAATSQPGIVVIEAPMGEGKTEAALFLLDRWVSSGARGAYIAMPTMATSNQMYGRFATYLGRAFPGARVTLQRAHSGAALIGDAVDPIVLLDEVSPPVLDEPAEIGAVFDNEEGGRNPNVAAAEWFTQRKRALLAPYGVGTIDQALLGVLQTKHNFVRLFGLAGKPVLIDEVHAYDTYMSHLLDRLIEWLGAARSPVVLLSATLPAARRQALIAAYQRGMAASITSPPDESPAAVSYPRITWTDGSLVAARHIDRSASSRKLSVRSVADDIQSVATLLGERLANGGCAAIICNTVARVQETFAQLRALLPGWTDEIELFHARFVMEDRLRIEERVLNRFGAPGSGAVRPGRAILVATQVLEQSLDLDFDLMISDPAPVDLLLQRSGRLMRHSRESRPPGFDEAEPTLFIRWDPDMPRGPAFDPGTAAVYAEHILLRTWRELRDRDRILIPAKIEQLIDAVYADNRQPPPTDAVSGRWEASWTTLRESFDSDRSLAKQRQLPSTAGNPRLDDFTGLQLDEDSPETHEMFRADTRLGPPSVQIVLLDEGDPRTTATTPPTRSQARDLLQRSVSLSAPRALVEALRQADVPAAWKQSPWLSRARLLVLSSGPAALGNLRVAYDSSLGLVVRRESDGL